MVTMRRLRIVWDGLGGLPGLSTFYYGVASPNVSDAVALFQAIKFQVPDTLSWTIPSSGDEIDSATGQLTGTWTGTGGGTVQGIGGTGSYAAGTGLILNWGTGIIHNGRRVQGRTFIAPVLASCYHTNGTIKSTVTSPVQTAVTAFVASGVAKGIWSKGRSPGDGVYAAISSGTVPTRVTSLRSRRV